MIRSLLLAVFCCCFMAEAGAQTISTRAIKEGLFIPWEIIYGPDDHIWFTQKNGYICRIDPATSITDTLYHETATVIRGEGGMTGLALHPNFPTDPYVYAVHNYLNGTAYRIKVVRYTYNGSNALNTPTVLLDGISGSQNHNGSRLLIVNNQLYITTGDAENLSNPQNISSINGKVLRINLDGSIPSDNPFPNNPVFSWGHRNPQGMVFANNMLYSSEHGPNNDDEINIIKKGRNYGWPTVAGYCDQSSEMTFCNDSNVAEPIWAWTPTLAVCGLDYYTGTMFPQLNGSLLMTTLKDAHLYQLQLNAAKDSVTTATVIPGVSFGRLRDICIAPSGKIYISTSNSGASGTGAFTDKIIELYNPNVEVPAVSKISMKLFPNPAKSSLTVVCTQPFFGKYEIIDISGRILDNGSIGGLKLEIPLNKIVSGTYFFRIVDEKNGTVMQQFIKTD